MRRTFIGVVTLMLLAGCSTADTPAATPSPAGPAAAEDCPQMAGSGTRQLRFGVGGATNLTGLAGGTGSTGIVLIHQSDGDLCQWQGGFEELIGKGYRALAFDVHGFGSSTISEAGYDDDVIAAAAALRADGAKSIVLFGASMGGTFALAAAPRIDPPVAAVISASGPAAYGGVGAEDPVATIKVPILFAAQADDEYFASDATTLHALAKASRDAQLKITPGSAHGVQLVGPGGDDATRAVVAAFLAQYAPPN
jgi:pimeloyl-ACP methyl ester carboxylesterase